MIPILDVDHRDMLIELLERERKELGDTQHRVAAELIERSADLVRLEAEGLRAFVRIQKIGSLLIDLGHEESAGTKRPFEKAVRWNAYMAWRASPGAPAWKGEIEGRPWQIRDGHSTRHSADGKYGISVTHDGVVTVLADGKS